MTRGKKMPGKVHKRTVQSRISKKNIVTCRRESGRGFPCDFPIQSKGSGVFAQKEKTQANHMWGEEWTQKSFSSQSMNTDWQISSSRNMLRCFPNRQASQVSFSWTQGTWRVADWSHLSGTVSEAVGSCFKLQVVCLLGASVPELLKPSDTFTYRSKPSEGEAAGLCNSSASALPAPASPQPPCLTWRIQVGEEAQESTEGQAGAGNRSTESSLFSTVLRDSVQLRIRWLFKTFGKNRGAACYNEPKQTFIQTLQGTLCVSRELGGGDITERKVMAIWSHTDTKAKLIGTIGVSFTIKKGESKLPVYSHFHYRIKIHILKLTMHRLLFAIYVK